MVNQFLATSDAVSCPLLDLIRAEFSVSYLTESEKPQTIVSTSLPTIVAELHGTQDEYAWVPVAYLLTQTACQPLYGKLADVFGRQVCGHLSFNPYYSLNLIRSPLSMRVPSSFLSGLPFVALLRYYLGRLRIFFSSKHPRACFGSS